MNKLALFLILFGGLFTTQAQEIDSIYVEIDSVTVDFATIENIEIALINPNALVSFYEKLIQLETAKSDIALQKINIVHVGDSHIQADLMTNVVREALQQQFGNGGRGLVFPYNLAKTNGPWDVKFSSNRSFSSYRNVSPVSSANIGLSGIVLQTKSKDFAIEVNAKESDNYFKTIKIITPNNVGSFDLAIAKKTISFESEVPKLIVHKIKSGDVLGSIAEKYNVSISALKKANGLKSNNIRAGKTLKIPTNENQKRNISRSEFIPLELQKDEFSHFYKSDQLLDKIYLIPNKDFSEFELNGLVLENDSNGILYHSIGVNGAKFSDYNKYPLFFEQLNALNADVLVLSLGTNESFDYMKSEDFMAQLDTFITNVRKVNPTVEIIVSTPPPSLFKRKYLNNFVADYSKKIVDTALDKKIAVWDLFGDMGGLSGINSNAKAGIIGKDKVHYSKMGYEKQGNLLAKAIMEAFENYKISKNNK